MSYRAIVDLCLSIDSFRNVGMFQQGMYFLTYQIYYFKENKKIYANPYANIPFIYSSAESKKNFRNVEPSEILVDEPIFKTRAFCIRFKHEEIPMNEVCQFRAEIDTDKYGDYVDTVFYMETKLHFLRFKFHNGATVKFVERLAQEERDQIKVVSTQTFKLTGCVKGMTEYIPTTFKGVYFSVAHGILHSALIDFKWREQLLLSIENDMDDSGTYVETVTQLSAQEYETLMYKYSYTPPRLQEYLLGHEKDFYEIRYNKSTLEDLFDVFISPLIQNWENLKRTYETLLIEEKESIFANTKPLTKIESKCPELEFCGAKHWKQYADREDKKHSESDKENQPLEREQADFHEDSDEEGNLDVGDEDDVIQKVYSVVDNPKEFFLNYNELKSTFVERVYSKNANSLVKNIEAEINVLAGQIIQCNYDLLMLIGTAPEDIREYFRFKHCARIKERVEDSVFRSNIKTDDFVISGEDDSRELYKIMAEKRRSNVYEELLDDLPVEDMTNLTHDTTPVMVEEVYEKEEDSKSSSKIARPTLRNRNYRDGLHLFVLVHGFQATHIDMQEIKNHIAMIVPNSVFL